MADDKDGKKGSGKKLKRKAYEKELAKLQAELVNLQEWVKLKGLKVCIVFEGRDGAGKGGVIKAITERVSPRVFRVVALARPDGAGEVADVCPALHAASARGGRDRDLRPELVQPCGRRAGDGLLHGEAGERLPADRPRLRETDDRLRHSPPKYWLEVSEEEQTRRLDARIEDGRKIWKLSPMDLKSYSRWYDYSRARDEMFAATDTAWAPWYVARSDDKRRARLNIITHLLASIDYKAPPRAKVKLPKRQKRGSYREPDYPYKFVPEKF